MLNTLNQLMKYILNIRFFHLQKMMIDLRNCYNANNDPPLESVSESKLYARKSQNDYRYATYHFTIRKIS